jgi:hypothetical protein
MNKIKKLLKHFRTIKKVLFEREDKEVDFKELCKDLQTYSEINRMSDNYFLEKLKRVLLDYGCVSRATSVKFNNDTDDVAWVDIYEVFGDDVTTAWVKEIWLESSYGMNGHIFYYVYVIYEKFYDYREESEEEILSATDAPEVLEKLMWKIQNKY